MSRQLSRKPAIQVDNSLKYVLLKLLDKPLNNSIFFENQVPVFIG